MAHWLRVAGAGTVAAATLLSISACSPIIALNRILVDQETYVAQQDIAYGPAERQKLDVYTPREVGQPAKIVVFFYGGSWKGGKRQYYPFIGESLTKRGFVVVVADYRVYPDVRFPAFVEDAALAVRWVFENAANLGGNPSEIYLMGHSAGAHIAGMLVTDGQYLETAGVPPSAIRGFIGLAGPYAFNPFRYNSTAPVFAGLKTPEPMQPVSFVTGSEPPMLLIHGEDDNTVKPVNTYVLGETVQRNGGKAEIIAVPDVGHIGVILAVAQPFAKPDGILDRIATFIDAN